MSSKEYYNTPAARLDTIIGDAAKTWGKVNAAKREYDSEKQPKESFYVWLQEVYGIKLQFTPDGELTLSNEIVDNYKYVLFLLKFSND
jgi:hypothetical protein